MEADRKSAKGRKALIDCLQSKLRGMPLKMENDE